LRLAKAEDASVDAGCLADCEVCAFTTQLKNVAATMVTARLWNKWVLFFIVEIYRGRKKRIIIIRKKPTHALWACAGLI
jgi:hypothetical protein